MHQLELAQPSRLYLEGHSVSDEVVLYEATILVWLLQRILSHLLDGTRHRYAGKLPNIPCLALGDPCCCNRHSSGRCNFYTFEFLWRQTITQLGTISQSERSSCITIYCLPRHASGHCFTYHLSEEHLSVGMDMDWQRGRPHSLSECAAAVHALCSREW